MSSSHDMATNFAGNWTSDLAHLEFVEFRAKNLKIEKFFKKVVKIFVLFL